MNYWNVFVAFKKVIDDSFAHFEGHQFMMFRQIDKTNFADVEITLLVVVNFGTQEVGSSSAEITVSSLAIGHNFLEGVRVKAGRLGARSSPAMRAE